MTAGILLDGVAHTFLGHIYDEQRRAGCVMVHDITVTADGTIYVAESDNNARPGYLWECSVG